MEEMQIRVFLLVGDVGEEEIGSGFLLIQYHVEVKKMKRIPYIIIDVNNAPNI